MLDNIFADPDKYLELSKRNDLYPMNPAVRESLVTGLTTGFLKGVAAHQASDSDADQQMLQLLP